MPKNEPVHIRLMRRVLFAASGCWEWQGSKDTQGYGRIKVGRRPALTHRISYEFFIGAIPADKEMDHLCKNTCCVNPQHLEPVTSKEHGSRSLKRQATYCKRGHEFNERNTYIRHNGTRWCLVCGSDRQRKRYERLRK